VYDTPISRFMLGVVFPLLIAFIVMLADYLEGPKVAFLGAVTSLPFMASIFGKPRSTAFVAAVVVLGAYISGLASEDSGTLRQGIRITLIALAAVAAVIYSAVRVKREQDREILATSKDELEASSRLALFDQLTGLLNRRGVIEALEGDGRWPRSVAILDLDKLKHINDTHGHAAGDVFIEIVAQRIKRVLSGSDVVGRWGGDEFIVVLPLTQKQALSVITRVLGQVSSEPIAAGSVKIEPRLSAGVSEWLRVDSLEHALVLADISLYAAKASGGNKAMAETTPPQLSQQP